MTRRLEAGRGGVPGAVLAAVAACVLGLGPGAEPAAAQLAVDRFELGLEPGDPSLRTGVVAVRNEGTAAVQAELRIEDWDRGEDGTNRWFARGTVPGSCGAALDVFPRQIRLEPGDAQSVRVLLSPAAPADRECWGALVVETVQPRTVNGREVAYVVRTAVKVYAGPPGLAADGVVGEMRMAPAAGTQPGATLSVAFDNAGARHLEGRGRVEFRRPDNSVAARVELPELYVLPGARRRVAVPVPALAPGRYVALAIVDYGGEEVAAGQIEYDAR
ncbi:MAG TPA: fimbria/pilus periplasmic chaperone [Longimicrobiales bacterium]|nr:fimbria/pilus periplasmic chaperone [Longimicrobiales bacterium]